MVLFKKLFPRKHEVKMENDLDELDESSPLIAHEHEEYREQDISILQDEDGTKEERLHQQATKEVQSAAEDSLKKLHVLRLGRCPSCGEHLRRHLFASICENCGWHTFEAPRNGPVVVHLKSGETLQGDRCYFVKDRAVLVIKNDLVVAKLTANAYDHIEYLWSDAEINQRHRQVNERMKLTCGWCNDDADPEKDGFHLVHIAFGTSQERYCFCCDECYEAFRKMYPSRVHRNCYERDCSECELCTKRYADGVEGMHMLAKDYLTVVRKPRK